jgi:hypothetical protein
MACIQETFGLLKQQHVSSTVNEYKKQRFTTDKKANPKEHLFARLGAPLGRFVVSLFPAGRGRRP